MVVVCNLKPAKMRDVMSYGMVGTGRRAYGSGWRRGGSEISASGSWRARGGCIFAYGDSTMPYSVRPGPG